MTPSQKYKAKKWLVAIGTIVATGLIFTFFAIKQIASASTYQINTNQQTLQTAFERVSLANYTSTFNTAKIKEFAEFRQYIRESHSGTDYYNLILLCQRMRNELFKELDRNSTLAFYCVGTNRVVSPNSTQESSYYFRNLGTTTEAIEDTTSNKYFLSGNNLIRIKHDIILGKDVFWIISVSTNELFKGILRDDLYWSLFDRDNTSIYSNINASTNLGTTPRRTYVDHYSANYFHYYTPEVFDYSPLFSAALYTFFTSFFLIVIQQYSARRRFRSITQELNIPNIGGFPDDIVDKIREMKDESQVLEESYKKVKKATNEDSLKDFFRGVKTYIELEPAIIDVLGHAKLLLLCVNISPSSNTVKGFWKEIYHYIKKDISPQVFVMSPEKLLILCPAKENEQCLGLLDEYAQTLLAYNHTALLIRAYDKTDRLQEMEGANFEFDIEIDPPLMLDENEDAKNKMLHYIHNNYARDISLTNLAEHMNQTEKYTSTLFKHETGTNFKEYLTQYRMKKAEKVLLTEDDVKIKSLAKKVGYNSSNSFIRVFRNYFGISPLNYKKQSEDPDVLL